MAQSDPNMMSSGSDDPGSPLTAVLKYLSSKGYTPNAGNIRTAIEENARNPGLIEGLRNAAPEDSAPMVTRAVTSNRGPIVDQSNQDTGYHPDQSNTASAPGETPRGGSGSPETSAPPPSASSSNLDKAIAAGGAVLPSLVSALILGRRPAPTVAPPTAAAAGDPLPDAGVAPPPPAPEAPGRVAAGFRDNPVSPAAVAIDRATENAPVISGVKPVESGALLRSQATAGPTVSVAGNAVPVMPNAATRRAIRTEPGRAPLFIRPRVPLRVP